MTLSQNRFAPLYVLGLGPGGSEHLTPAAHTCLEQCSVVCGYEGYITLLDPARLQGKNVISTGMMGEVARAKKAVEAAMHGETTVVVCSGDPGVYALAGLVLEIIENSGLYAEDFPLHIVPGIPAVCAAAALLGAPLMHDFAVISLSDLLTPYEKISHRLECAFNGDFVTALYNPKSKRRSDHLQAALECAKKYREGSTPVGIVRNAFREDQRVVISPLNKTDTSLVDMFTLVLIGNSMTRIVAGKGEKPLSWENGARMLTPRGYAGKYDDLALASLY